MSKQKIQLTLEEINSIILSLNSNEKNVTNLSCPICSKRCTDITTHLLLDHTIQEHHGCYMCSAKFEDKLYLQLHIVNHLNTKQFKCTFCDIKFKEEILRKIHEIKEHQEDNYLHRCNICRRTFKKNDSFFKHLLVHVEHLNPVFSKYFCNICEEYYFTLTRLENHFINTHLEKFDSLNGILENDYLNLNYNYTASKKNTINVIENNQTEIIERVEAQVSPFNQNQNIILDIESDSSDIQENLIEEHLESPNESLMDTHESVEESVLNEDYLIDEDCQVEIHLDISNMSGEIEKVKVQDDDDDLDDDNKSNFIEEYLEDENEDINDEDDYIGNDNNNGIDNDNHNNNDCNNTDDCNDNDNSIDDDNCEYLDDYNDDINNDSENNSLKNEQLEIEENIENDLNYDSDDDLPVFEFFEDMPDTTKLNFKLMDICEIENLKFNNKSRSKGSGRKFACPICTKLFRTRAIVNEHLNTHTGQRPYTCTICTQRFSFKGALQRHIKAHNNEKNCICAYCDEGFITNFEKKRHERIWHGDTNKLKTYKEKKLLNPKALKNSADGLYHCAFCKKKYQRAQSLRQHLKIHTNTKVCTICKQGFGFLSSLKRHMLNVHDITLKSESSNDVEIEILEEP